MSSKVLSISITGAQLWKLEELRKSTGISKSGLIQRALMYLFTDTQQGWWSPNGIDIEDITRQLEDDYQGRLQ